MNELKIKKILVQDLNKDIISVHEVSVDEYGIVGDKHKDSHLILLEDETYTRMLEYQDSALCMNKFYPHLVYENCDLKPLIKLNDIELSLVEKGKPCHKKEGCQYFEKYKACPLISEVYEYKIISGGEIKID
jgi:hypothetical protein